MQLLEPLHQLDALYLTIVQEGDGVDLGVLTQVSGQLRPRGVRHGGDILDARRLIDLTADALGHDGYLEPLAGGVDGGGNPCWATTDDDEVIGAADGLGTDGLGAYLSLEGEEELAEGGLTYVDEFVPHIYGGDAGDAEAVDLSLEEGAVDHLVLEAGVIEGHEVERLHDLGTVGTAEGGIGGQAQRRLEGSDATDEDLLG